MSDYPHPHEGISGTNREGDPLMTVEGSLVATDMMRLLHQAVLVGQQAPIVREMYDRMYAPQIGDPVVVLDAIYRRDDDTKNKGVGYLIADREDWAQTDEQWQAELAEDPSLAEGGRHKERAWYVQYGPEPVDVCRWSNCTVLAIPRATRES